MIHFGDCAISYCTSLDIDVQELVREWECAYADLGRSMSPSPTFAEMTPNYCTLVIACELVAFKFLEDDLLVTLGKVYSNWNVLFQIIQWIHINFQLSFV